MSTRKKTRGAYLESSWRISLRLYRVVAHTLGNATALDMARQPSNGFHTHAAGFERIRFSNGPLRHDVRRLSDIRSLLV
jgi:hypothetical protein